MQKASRRPTSTLHYRGDWRRPIDVTVKPFYPEQFLIMCGTQTTRAHVLTTNPLPVHPVSFTLRPWSRIGHADLSVLRYRVRLEIEGIPPHVWREDTAAKLLAPSCWIAEVDEATATTTDLSSYKLTAWTRDPSAIPTEVRLAVAENEVSRGDGGVRFRGARPFLRVKKTPRYRVIIHLRSVHDYSPCPDSPAGGPSSDDGDSGHDGDPERHCFHRGTAPEIQGYRCLRGVPDGTSGGGGAGDPRRGGPGAGARMHRSKGAVISDRDRHRDRQQRQQKQKQKQLPKEQARLACKASSSSKFYRPHHGPRVQRADR